MAPSPVATESRSADWLTLSTMCSRPSSRVLVRFAAVVVVTPDRRDVVSLDHVGVDHPAEQVRMEIAADRVAFGPGRDRALRAEHGLSVLALEVPRFAAFLRQAPVHVLVPSRDAEWDPVVQPVEARVLRHRVHRADEPELAVRAARIE